MRPRMILVSVITAVVTFGVVSPALSAEGGAQEYVETELQAQRSPDGVRQTVVVEKVVSAAGRVLRRSRTTIDNPRVRTMADSPFACVHEGHRAGLTQHDPEVVSRRGRNDFAQFYFFPYSVDDARRGRDGQRHQQWVICATGGADANNGSRTVMAGPGIYFRDAGHTYKLGQVWKEGKTPASYSLNLGFEVPTDYVTVKAGMTQTPTSSLRGSPRPPFDSDAEAYTANGASGWWEADCAPDCVGTGGSNGYQGSVVEGLWEFPQSKAVSPQSFLFAGFHKHRCANPFGCG
ncbi:MAG: hypothetical protein ACRDZ3_01135 [Acidimicrobiia bacterium]